MGHILELCSTGDLDLTGDLGLHDVADIMIFLTRKTAEWCDDKDLRGKMTTHRALTSRPFLF